MDRELFWLLTIDCILGLFTPFCTESCGSKRCPGKTYCFRGVKKAQEEKKEWTQWPEQMSYHMPALSAMA